VADDNVIDLMAALEKSLKSRGASGKPKPAERRKPLSISFCGYFPTGI